MHGLIALKFFHPKENSLNSSCSTINGVRTEKFPIEGRIECKISFFLFGGKYLILLWCKSNESNFRISNTTAGIRVILLSDSTNSSRLISDLRCFGMDLMRLCLRFNFFNVARFLEIKNNSIIRKILLKMKI